MKSQDAEMLQLIQHIRVCRRVVKDREKAQLRAEAKAFTARELWGESKAALQSAEANLLVATGANDWRLR